MGEIDLDPNNIELLVTDLIHNMGVPSHIKGYYYLRDSIIIAIHEPEIINSITQLLYPAVAKKKNTTPARVERAIRHSIAIAWERTYVNVLKEYFGDSVYIGHSYPTNSEVIALITHKLRERLGLEKTDEDEDEEEEELF